MNKHVFAYLVPYWRRLVLVLVISLISTATTLVIPYLSKEAPPWQESTGVAC